MEPKKFQLFINGKNYLSRGLDLAFNPHNGNVLGQVVLISEAVLHEKEEEQEDTVRIFYDEDLS